MTVEEILAGLEEHRADEHDLAGMARYGIRTDNAYGVKLRDAAAGGDARRARARARWVASDVRRRLGAA